ncbi:MAG TPA: hypothetical protein VND44_08515 [Acidimicrobiales bacterium]|nr:hypothetical protein [Acidimicrobiales bacterium]
MKRGSHGSATEDRGRCHRCGWTLPVTRVSRKRARQLQIGRHATRLCDECLAELNGSEVTALAERPAAAEGVPVTSRRHRVA